MKSNPEHITYDQLIIAARTVYAEARGEPEDGVLAVACTLWNRVRRQSWFGKTLDRVCLYRWQYSCWNPKTVGQPEDANYKAMMRATTARLKPYIDAVLKAQHVAGTADDPSLGACHYFAPKAVVRRPRWAKGKRPDVVIGAHEFYVGIK